MEYLMFVLLVILFIILIILIVMLFNYVLDSLVDDDNNSNQLKK